MYFLKFSGRHELWKKLRVVRKVAAFFVVVGISIQKIMNTKIKLTRCVFSTEKTAPVLPILNSGSFSIFKSTITQKVLWRSKKQKSKREYRTTRKHQLSHQGIIRTKISTPKMLTSVLLQKYRQSSGKEEQPISHLFPRSIHMLESNEL